MVCVCESVHAGRNFEITGPIHTAEHYHLDINLADVRPQHQLNVISSTSGVGAMVFSDANFAVLYVSPDVTEMILPAYMPHW